MEFSETVMVRAADGTVLAVHRRPGPGPSVVFNHGGTGAGRPCWTRVLSSLPADWDVLAPDARGHGKSGRGPSYSWDHLVGDLSAVVKGLDLAQPTMVGHSMGAETVALYASRHNGVSCAVVEDPPWWISPDREFLRQKPVDVRETLIDRQQQSVDSLLAHFAKVLPGQSAAEHLSFAEALQEVDPAVIGDDFL